MQLNIIKFELDIEYIIHINCRLKLIGEWT